MNPDFAVVYQAVFAFMHEFNRVLDRDDVVAPILVGIIYHGRQGGGLARAGRTGDYHQAAMEHGKFFQHCRQRSVEFFEILERKHLAWNLAEHGGDAVFLVEEIRPEAGNVGNLVAKINVARFLEDFDFVFGRDFVEHLLERVIVEWRMVHPLQLPVDSQHGVVVRGKVQIRGLLLEH